MASSTIVDPRRQVSASVDGVPTVEGYRIVERVAVGGMGVVYVATAESTGRRVALKLVHPEHHGAVAADRILREIEVLSGLEHPGIVEYVDHGKTGDGLPFLAMEWLDGVDLEARLQQGPLPIDETLALARRVSEALVVAHDAGVIHRDIKPSNLFLVGGRPADARLLDFGIARFRGSTATLTMPGGIIGTPGYMSPEQARGDDQLDLRTDLFSLGCVLYECLGGRPAFSGEHVIAVLAKVLMHDPPPLRESVDGVSRALDELLGSLLDKRSSSRIASAHELLRRLGELETASSEPSDQVQEVLTGDEQVLHSVLFLRRHDEPGAATVDLAELAQRHLGHLVTMIDGTRLIVMNRRGAASDQAASAARCALALREHAPGLAIAVASGQGMVTGQSIVGQVLDRGAALLQHASRGHIRIDEVTTSLLDGGFEVGGDELGLTLMEVREVNPGARRLMGRPSPLVGRRRELAFLEEAVDECIDERCVAAVVVVGEAGAGKSRLRHELDARVRARPGAPVATLIGRADPMRAQAPFSLMSRVLHGAAGLRDGEPASVRRQKLTARLSRHVGAGRLDSVVLYLGELVDAFAHDAPLELQLAREDSAVLRERIEDAWCAWLRAEGEASALLFVLEDLQWADAATVQVMDSVLERLTDVPMLVLALARPAVDERFGGLWAEREIDRLELTPLSSRAARMLVHEVLDGAIEADEVERIVAGARGNAFFLEELIRATAEGSGRELPDSVLGMMQARLGGLGVEERQVLRAASVFGQTAWRGGICGLLGQDERAVEPTLARLVEAEWLSPQPSSQIPGEAEYVFRHALVRDAAYATLVDADREVGHRQAARWLEGAGGHEAVVLAEHYRLGREHAEALEWYATAADQAFERHDFEVLLGLVEHGTALGVGGEARGRLLLRKAEVCGGSGRHKEAAEAALSALDDLPLDTPRWYCAAGEAAVAIGRSGETDRVLEMVDRLMEMDVVGEGAAIHFSGLVQAAIPLAAAGEAVAARRLLDKIIRVTSAVVEHDPGARGPLHSALTLRAMVAGDIGTAHREMEEAASAYEESGNVRTALEHRVGAGFLLLELGGLADAEPVLRRTIEEASRLRLEHVIAVARHNLGRRVAEAGRVAEGLEMEAAALASFQRHANRRMMGLTRCHIASILLLDGRVEEAASHMEQALRELADHTASRAIGRATRARILVASGEAELALEDARKALADLESLDQVQEGESMIRLTWAEALAAAGSMEEARAAIEVAHRNLMERARRIDSERLRRSFSREVAENARIVELANQWTPLSPSRR